MSQTKEKSNSSRYEQKFCLSELYSLDDLNKLLKIFPELTNLNQSTFISNFSPNRKLKKKSFSNKDESINFQEKINKFLFFKIFLSKLKIFFEVSESFIISKTLNILISEIENIEKYFFLSSSFSKSKTRNELKNEKEYKSPKKIGKIQQLNYKNISSNPSKMNKNKRLNNNYFNLIKTLSNPFDINSNLKKKVYFRVLDHEFHKENKTEIDSYSSKNNENKNIKKININLNETERTIKNINLSLSEIKQNEFNKTNGKQKTFLEQGLKISTESNINTHPNNLSHDIDKNNSYNKTKSNTISNKSDLYNNSNNLYINIYGQKKNINSSEMASLSIQSKASTELKINKRNYSNNNYSNFDISLLSNIESDDFDIFELEQKASKKILSLIGYYIFNRFGFHNIIKYSKFENWCKKITEGYNRKNPYHTDLHAADITQTCLIFFKIGKVNEACKLSHLSKCSLFLSCICHDFKHPGVSNDFLKETKDILAIKYNDYSILENMHISEAFKLTIDYENCDIFSEMNSDDYKQMRKEMISCVLYTDIIRHKETIYFMETLAHNKNNNNDKKKENEIHQHYMNLLIHAADISNPTNKYDIYIKWANLIVEEFFQQGDKEKKLGIKCTYDRQTMTSYQNQLEFMNLIGIEFYTLFVSVFPKLKYLLENLNNNKNEVLKLQEKEKENENKKINDKNKI